MCIKYLSFLLKIDREILIPFIKMTYNHFYKWNDISYYTLKNVLEVPFSKIGLNSKNERLFLLSQPEIWLLYYKDPDFIDFKNKYIDKLDNIETIDDMGDKWSVVFQFYKNNNI